MSTHPVPQLVNGSHALAATVIEEMRNTLDTLQQQKQFNEDQVPLLMSYLAQLNGALLQFTEDNKHVKPGVDGVTSGDLDLINGLITLYKDYIYKFNNIEKKFSSMEAKPQSKIDTISRNSSNVNLDEGIRALKEVKQVKKSVPTSTPKREIYIADSSKKKKSIETNNTILTDENIKENQINKKKISFTKYKKKEDSPINSNDETSGNNKRTSIQEENMDNSNSERSPKKMKLDENSTKIRSILKNSETSDKTKQKKKKKVGISFPVEDDLVRVYGDDLPTTGLKVTPTELKKILRPFKEGEPKEKVLIEGFNSKPKLLNIQVTIKDSDISQLKNGPIKFETMTPLLYRDNFRNFSKDLKKPAREPIPEMGLQHNGTTPLVAQAYGRNGLLLRNDRGGIPYKRVPEVRRNKYPSRYQ